MSEQDELFLVSGIVRALVPAGPHPSRRWTVRLSPAVTPEGLQSEIECLWVGLSTELWHEQPKPLEMLSLACSGAASEYLIHWSEAIESEVRSQLFEADFTASDSTDPAHKLTLRRRALVSRPGLSSREIIELLDVSVESSAWERRAFGIRGDVFRMVRCNDVALGGVELLRQLPLRATDENSVSIAFPAQHGHQELFDPSDAWDDQDREFEQTVLNQLVETHGLEIEWHVERELLPDRYRADRLELSSALGAMWPIYRGERVDKYKRRPNPQLRCGPLRDFYDGFTVGLHRTQPVPVGWLGGRHMRFEADLRETVLDPTPTAQELRALIEAFAGAGDELADETLRVVAADCRDNCEDFGHKVDDFFDTPADLWQMPNGLLAPTAEARYVFEELVLRVSVVSPWEEEHGLDLFFAGDVLYGRGRSGDFHDRI